MRWFSKIVGQGFIALIPIVLTVWLFIGVGMWIERLVANPLKGLLPHDSEFYRMGMGIAVIVIFSFLIGLLLRFWLVRRLFGWVEGWFRQLPLVKTVYGAIHDVMQFVGGKKQTADKGDMVVVVKQQNGWRQVGIVTRQNFGDLPPEIEGGKSDQVAVYFPFSYQLGGFSYFVEKSLCEPVPGMSVEDVMRYSMMAWLGSGVPGRPPTPTTAQQPVVDRMEQSGPAVPEGEDTQQMETDNGDSRENRETAVAGTGAGDLVHGRRPEQTDG